MMSVPIKTVPVNLTCKIRPKVNNVQAKLFYIGSDRYTKALNYDSKIFEDNNQDLKVKDFHHDTYYPTKNKFKLKSFMTESARREVQSKYRAVDVQKKHTRYNFLDKNCYFDKYYWKHGRCYKKRIYKWYHVRENGHWIWHRIHFLRKQMYLLYGEDWSIKGINGKNHTILLSVNTIRKHITKKYAKKHHCKPQKSRTLVRCYIPKYFRKYFNMNPKYQSLRILHNGNKFTFHIGITLNVKCLSDLSQAVDIYGSDRGQRFIGWVYDSYKHSIVFRGLKHRKERRHLLRIHSNLQYKHNKKHSHSALQKMAFNRRTRYGYGYMNDVNNRISKTQVSRMKHFSVIGYERLADIRSALENSPKKHRYTMVSWSFGSYGHKVQYKGLYYKGILFVHIPAYNTSNRDPLTGLVDKNHRHHDNHVYYSFKMHYSKKQHRMIHYQFNDDLIGGINIQFLTTLLCIGYVHPVILKDGRISYRKYNTNGKYKVKHLGRIQAINIYKKFNRKHF